MQKKNFRDNWFCCHLSFSDRQCYNSPFQLCSTPWGLSPLAPLPPARPLPPAPFPLLPPGRLLQLGRTLGPDADGRCHGHVDQGLKQRRLVPKQRRLVLKKRRLTFKQRWQAKTTKSLVLVLTMSHCNRIHVLFVLIFIYLRRWWKFLL